MTFYCRVCKEFIEDEEISRGHVQAHKRKYLSEQGKNPDRWWEADWEDVVRHLNPENAKPVKEPLTEQVYLCDFERE